MIEPILLDTNIVETYLKEALILQGKLLALTEEKKQVRERVEKAKKWIQRQPEYLKFLQHLQDIYHQKNIGAFSELLSYFVRDVLQKEKDIILELYTYHNLPALRIEASNEGNREDIMLGNGGSIANIVSTGLRLIALSRMTNRKFIVLDEPDCWLKPDHVPLFARIIGEISNKLNIQTVIISHHSWQYFKDYGRVIELKKEGPHLTTQLIHDTPIPENANDDVIKKVILRRFMSHYDTTFELHPNLTCIIGENDIGKSVFGVAMKAFSYNDSKDSFIMHHENEAQMICELNQKRIILWQRFRETTQENPMKVKYTLYKGDEVPVSAFDSNNVPEFILKEINISTVEDIDIHIGNQKQPVFLLSSDVKPNDKAKILSLGKDSLVIQKMMENIKSKTKFYKSEEKEGEKRYAIIEKQSHILNDINDIVSQLEQLRIDSFSIIKQHEQIIILDNIIANLKVLEVAMNIYKVEEFNIIEPKLHNIRDLDDVIDSLYINEKLSKIPTVSLDIKNISLHNTKDLEEVIHYLAYYGPVAKIEKIETNLEIPNLYNVKELGQAIHALKILEKAIKIETLDTNIEIPKLYNIQELGQTISVLKVLEKAIKIENLDTNIEIPKLHNIQELEDIIQKLKHELTLENELKIKLDNLEKWKIILDKEKEDFLNKYQNICPTCQQPITKDHFLGNKHA